VLDGSLASLVHAGQRRVSLRLRSLVLLADQSRFLSPAPSLVQSRVLSPRLLSRSRLTPVKLLDVLSLISRLR